MYPLEPLGLKRNLYPLPYLWLNAGLSKYKIEKKKQIYGTLFWYAMGGTHVSTSTPWALGTSDGHSGHAIWQQRLANQVKASAMFGSHRRQLMSCKYRILLGVQAFCSVSKGGISVGF